MKNLSTKPKPKQCDPKIMKAEADGNGIKATQLEVRIAKLESETRLQFENQNKVLSQIQDAIGQRAGWRSFIPAFTVFAVALGAAFYPLRRDVDELQKFGPTFRNEVAKDVELIKKDLANMNRENVWNWDGTKTRITAVEESTKARISALERIADISFGRKPENKL